MTRLVDYIVWLVKKPRAALGFGSLRLLAFWIALTAVTIEAGRRGFYEDRRAISVVVIVLGHWSAFAIVLYILKPVDRGRGAREDRHPADVD